MATNQITRRTILRTTVATAALAVPVTLAGAPLPSGKADAAIIAAEAEIARMYAWLGRQSRDTKEQEDALQPTYDRIYEIEDFIAAASPVTAAGAAAKMRRLLDDEVGLVTGESPQDFPSMLRILDYLHGAGGLPTHPTRPLWSEEETAALPAPIPVAQIAPQPGRCVALVEEWHSIHGRRGMTDEESDAVGDRLCEIENELDDTAAETMADILAKARLVAHFEDQGITFGGEHDPMIAGSLLVDLMRFAGGAS